MKNNQIVPQTGKFEKPDIEDLCSSLIAKNVTVAGRRTSIRLEPELWSALKEISVREKRSVNEICTSLQKIKQPGASLTSAIRVYLIKFFRGAAQEILNKSSPEIPSSTGIH